MFHIAIIHKRGDGNEMFGRKKFHSKLTAFFSGKWACKIEKTFRKKVATFVAHLFVKIPRPRDSKMTFAVFESSCHLLLPV